MIEWEKIQKIYKMRELKFVSLISILIILGGIFDWCVQSKEIILIPMNNIESFSLAILQIQATVSTLILTIITLITGNISDSYMGVSIVDFYLNIKPWKLTQKRLIISVLTLSILSITLHSLGCYNTVFFLFISTLAIILLSIIEIYSSLVSKFKQYQEIESYVNYIINSKMSFEDKINSFNDFVSEWKKIADSQSKPNFNYYSEIFLKYLVSLLEYRSKDSFSSIEQQCYSILYCLLESDRRKSKENGLELFQNIYDKIWYFIFNNRDRLLIEPNSEFPLFTDIYYILVDSIEELKVEDLERKLNFKYLADSILRVNIWLEYCQENNDNATDNTSHKKIYNNRNEISELNSFARYLGYYLGKMNSKNNMIDQNFWARILRNENIFSTYNIPNKYKEEFLNVKMYTYFCYCYGMIVNGQENIIKKGIHLNASNYILEPNKKHQILFYLSIHCYTYYLAKREHENCISNSIRRSALNLWEDKDFQNFFCELLNEIADTPEHFGPETSKNLYKLLDNFELFPDDMNAKTMIMETVVTDFYLFITLFLYTQYYIPDLLENNIDDSWAFTYISHGSEYRTKSIFKQLFQLVSINNSSEEKIDNYVNSMYDNLEIVVKKKQKERYIALARNEQIKFDCNNNNNKISDQIKDDVSRQIYEKFKPIILENTQCKETITVPLLTLTDFTKSFEEKYNINIFSSTIYSRLLIEIEKFLIDKKVVDFRNRFYDFTDDNEFMNYLEEHNLRLLLGSKYILKNRDYKIREDYQKFLKRFDIIYTNGIQDGIALKKNSINLCIHKIKVLIHSPTIEELDIEYDRSTGLYRYSILDDTPIDFSEEELNEFLRNYKKTIKITAKISIQINETYCGTILKGRKREEQQ